MAQTLVEIAKDLTVALIQTGNMSPDAMQHTLEQTHTTLARLKTHATAPVDWRTSITRYTVTCLECGQTFKKEGRS